jgi:hypothetical protein
MWFPCLRSFSPNRYGLGQANLADDDGLSSTAGAWWRLALLGVGAAGLGGFGLATAFLVARCEPVVEAEAIHTFRAPGVPLLPCLALLANFFLMAQYV